MDAWIHTQISLDLVVDNKRIQPIAVYNRFTHTLIHLKENFINNDQKYFISFVGTVMFVSEIFVVENIPVTWWWWVLFYLYTYCKAVGFYALNTLTKQMYGYMTSDIGLRTTEYERRNPLLPLHGLLFPITSKGSIICTIPHTG